MYNIVVSRPKFHALSKGPTVFAVNKSNIMYGKREKTKGPNIEKNTCFYIYFVFVHDFCL